MPDYLAQQLKKAETPPPQTTNVSNQKATSSDESDPTQLSSRKRRQIQTIDCRSQKITSPMMDGNSDNCVNPVTVNSMSMSMLSDQENHSSGPTCPPISSPPTVNSDPSDMLSTYIVIDGKSYTVLELINLVSKLKGDVRKYSEQVDRLEQEIQKSRTIISSQDSNIDKMKSVLDQKLPSPTLHQNWFDENDKVGEETDRLGSLPQGSPGSPAQCKFGSNRMKKQGVSGESSVYQATERLSYFQKDPRSASLIREAIGNNDFLRQLESSQVEEIVRCMYKKHIPENTYVIHEGEMGDALYVVAEGVLEVSKGAHILGHMNIGRAFGELALLYNCKRTASVRAINKSSAWTLDRHIFRQIMMSSCMHQHDETYKFLQSVPALKTLSPEKMHKLVDVVDTLNYGPNEYIIREGEIGETFFIIQSGEVRVTKSSGASENLEIRRLAKGDWFGEKALYTLAKRSANVIAMENGVKLLCLDRSNFIYLIGDLNEIKTKDYGDLQRDNLRLEETGSDISSSTIHAEEPIEVPVRIAREDLVPIAILGIGGFGRVELVTWKNTSQSYALKRMKKQHIVQTRQQEHICSERKILFELNCEFICRLYCTYKDPKYVYMLMEVCLGGELWTMLRNRGHFSDGITRFVVACVLEAFTHLHTKGIIYRDLKPENLLMDNKGYIKVCDFGFAKHLTMGKKTWTFCGTPEYVAPEIILNKGHDFSADYWSLGILIFELLTGSPPFTGADPMKIYNVVLRGIDAIEFPATKITRIAGSLIKRLCTANPAQRLGYGSGGIIDIKQNKYFQGFDWIGLHRGTLSAPIQPRVSGPTDTSNFDKYPDKPDNPPDELSGWDADF